MDDGDLTNELDHPISFKQLQRITKDLQEAKTGTVTWKEL
jgi:hypothetical protein